MRKIVEQEKLSYLAISALGIVFGDIGTSPLYALKSCFMIGNIPVNTINVFGIISLFIWSLILVVSLKYINLVLKMTHQGEGGILALSTLVASNAKYRKIAVTLGILGAALFFGDGIITPAISVLSAVEGVTIISDQLTPYIVPIAVVILAVLFIIQKFGSSKIGKFFGPIMLCWFLILMILGVYQITKYPWILRAVNPYHAFNFLMHNSLIGFSVMGGVILVVTGVEALYADLGHFGKKPIELSWHFCVFPALVCNYLGQGALLLNNPKAISNPFFLMAPDWALYLLIALATVATIIAAQSVLSGLFSITYHSILLNYLPRLKVDHTSENFRGQIYVRGINYLLCILTISTVIQFGSSEQMSLAYGLCIASIMLTSTSLIFLHVLKSLKWNLWKIIMVFVPFFSVDLFFLFSNLIKSFEGAWYVLIVASIVFYCITTWRKGTKIIAKQKNPNIPLETFLKTYEYQERIPATALFLSREPFKVPSALLMNLRHNKYLHQKIIFVSFANVDTPYFYEKRFEVHEIIDNYFQIVATFGFMEKPNVSKLLTWLRQNEFLDPNEDVSIFLSRIVPTRAKSSSMSKITESLYFYLATVAQNATDFFHIIPQKVVEFGIRYRI